ncbi:TPA: hypothetical protein IAC10_14400 [Candidatus Scatousia excrementigallinarum]|uniref:Uncharacterized protein n=1 Tax=Candidatus Scatousia excrementigallinarum TaxID=2840935 RepID=A0A9D1JP81_9BACT|nr:hypothetical protein [Candidatus Scatousia excrementigallinarum]
MKNVLLRLGLIVIFCVSPVWAERLHVQAMSDFSTFTPCKNITFKALNAIELSPDVKLWGGYIVQARIYEVIPPKRLKRNAGFKIVPVKYTDTNGNTYSINQEFIGKYSPKFELDKGELAKNAALSVGDYFLKGLSLGYHAVEGAVKNEEGNRAKSSVVSVYKNSPLSYVENGQEIEIKKDDLFSFTFKTIDEEDDDTDLPDAMLPNDKSDY